VVSDATNGEAITIYVERSSVPASPSLLLAAAHAAYPQRLSVVGPRRRRPDRRIGPGDGAAAAWNYVGRITGFLLEE